MYYTGLDPRTMEPVYVPVNPHEKAMQRALIQYRNPKNYELVEEALRRAGRTDLIGYDKKCLIRPRGGKNEIQKGGSPKTGKPQVVSRPKPPGQRKRFATSIKRKDDIFMKIALVTGASSGMGRETVIQLADRFGGLDEIWAVARRENRLEELEEEIPVRLRKFALDVTDEAQLEILRQALEAERPQVRILVNAAGYGKIGPVGSHCMEEETGMVAVNCQALVAITHMLFPTCRTTAGSSSTPRRRPSAHSRISRSTRRPRPLCSASAARWARSLRAETSR